jgi:hypothetical protein
MENAEDDNVTILNREVDCVWKSPEQVTAKLVIDTWPKQWIMRNLTGTGIEGTKELLA